MLILFFYHDEHEVHEDFGRICCNAKPCAWNNYHQQN